MPALDAFIHLDTAAMRAPITIQRSPSLPMAALHRCLRPVCTSVTSSGTSGSLSEKIAKVSPAGLRSFRFDAYNRYGDGSLRSRSWPSLGGGDEQLGGEAVAERFICQALMGPRRAEEGRRSREWWEAMCGKRTRELV